MTPEDVLDHIEAAWADGYSTAKDTLAEIADKTDNPEMAAYFRAAAQLLEQVRPKSKGWALADKRRITDG